MKCCRIRSSNSCDINQPLDLIHIDPESLPVLHGKSCSSIIPRRHTRFIGIQASAFYSTDISLEQDGHPISLKNFYQRIRHADRSLIVPGILSPPWRGLTLVIIPISSIKQIFVFIFLVLFDFFILVVTEIGDYDTSASLSFIC